MKDKYACDIGDFGKYLLLSLISAPKDKTKNLKLGVNWYLTPDDKTPDGKIIDYLYKGEVKYSLPPLSVEIHGKLKNICDLIFYRRNRVFFNTLTLKGR
jgi:hypothetical protein